VRYPTAAFAEPMASCSTGYAEMSEQCPEPDDDAETKAVAHWNTNPEPSNELPTPHASGLWKYDPDIDPRITDQPWMRACLFGSTYPVLWRKRRNLFSRSGLKSVREGEAINHSISPPRARKRPAIAQSMRKADFVA